jgi:hypothetical protein
MYVLVEFILHPMSLLVWVINFSTIPFKTSLIYVGSSQGESSYYIQGCF